jgi:hypothetical protein
MKFKRLFLFLFLFVFFFFVGCDQEKKDVENIEKLLSQYQEETDVDLSYEYVMSLNGETTTIAGTIIVKKVGEEYHVYMEMMEGIVSIKMYVIGNYICMLDGDDVFVIEGEGFDYDEEVPIPQFDFDDFEYEYQKTEEDGLIIHSFDIGDDAILAYLDEFISEYDDNTEIQMNLEIIVDKEKEDLKRLNMYITATYEEITAELEMFITINNSGKDVKLNVPENVLEAIDDYIESQQG